MFESLELLDRQALLKINSLHHPFLNHLMWYASESWHTYLFVLVAAYFFYRRHSTKVVSFILGCALVVAAADISARAVKYGVRRHRPTHNTEIASQIHTVRDYKGGRYGFISSHAANVFGLTTFMFFAFSWIPRKRRWILYTYPIVIAYSRVYLGVHYPSDVFFGMLDGLFFGWLGFLVVNAYFLKLNETRDSRSAAA